MFDRYTDDARQVLFVARYEASRLGSPVLEAGHLWLGVIRQSPKLIKRHAPKTTAESIQRLLPPANLVAERTSMTAEIPLSEQAAAALAGAATLADAHGQHHITAEYLLLALLQGTSLPSGS